MLALAIVIVCLASASADTHQEAVAVRLFLDRVQSSLDIDLVDSLQAPVVPSSDGVPAIIVLLPREENQVIVQSTGSIVKAKVRVPGIGTFQDEFFCFARQPLIQQINAPAYCC